MLFLFIIISIICNVILSGLTAELLWNWFVAPLGIQTITFVWALGIGCFITAIMSRPTFTFEVRDNIYKKLEIECPTKLQAFFHSIVYKIITLGFGYVVHLFFHH